MLGFRGYLLKYLLKCAEVTYFIIFLAAHITTTMTSRNSTLGKTIAR